MTVSCFAHSGNGLNRDERFETVFEYVDAVTRRATQYGAAFGAEEQARAAGLLHDLGKYSSQFQRRLVDAREPGRDHWTLGALALLGQNKASAVMPVIAILGHHAGLPSLDSLSSLNQRLRTLMNEDPLRFTTSTLEEYKKARDLFLADGFEMPRLSGNGLVPRYSQAADMLDTRMLFSALVDADFVETEAHFDGDSQTHRRPRADGESMQVDAMIAALDR
jgi:CRISPR-associated endonuclease/helicase Cas3